MFCADGVKDCPADFSITINESPERGIPGVYDSTLPSGQDIKWYEICVPDASHGLEVEAYLPDSMNAQVPFILTTGMPSSIFGSQPSRAETLGTPVTVTQSGVMGPSGFTPQAMQDWQFTRSAMWTDPSEACCASGASACASSLVQVGLRGMHQPLMITCLV